MMDNLLSKAKPRQLVLMIVLATLASLTPLIYSLIRYHPSPNPSKTASTVPAASLPKLQAVSARGRIEPQGEIIKLSAPSSFGEGAKIAQLRVKEGDRVQVGQIVAVLDTNTRLNAALIQAQRSVQVSEAKLAQVQAGSQNGEIAAQQAEISILQAQLKGEAAIYQTERNLLQAQLREESKVKQAQITRLQSEFNNADAELKRYQLLYQEGAVEASIYDGKQLDRDTAIASLNEARASLAQTEQTLQQQIAQSRATYQQTVNTLQQQIAQASAKLNQIVEVRPTDVQVARAEIEQAIANFERAKSDLDMSYVRATREGQVLKIHTWPGEVVENDGILSLGQTDRMEVVAEVYETDIRRVRMGQQATIISNIFPKNLRGQITQIGLQISQQDVFSTDPVADVDRRVIEVKIQLNPEDAQQVVGLTNLQVEVLIDADSD